MYTFLSLQSSIPEHVSQATALDGVLGLFGIYDHLGYSLWLRNEQKRFGAGLFRRCDSQLCTNLRNQNSELREKRLSPVSLFSSRPGGDIQTYQHTTIKPGELFALQALLVEGFSTVRMYKNNSHVAREVHKSPYATCCNSTILSVLSQTTFTPLSFQLATFPNKNSSNKASLSTL